MDEQQLDKFACPHCGETKLADELVTRLDRLTARLPGGLPPVATGYRCEEWEKELGFGSGGAHTKGTVVSFETANQYVRHALLKAALEVFDQVTVYPNRVTVSLTEQKHPICLTVL